MKKTQTLMPTIAKIIKMNIMQDRLTFKNRVVNELKYIFVVSKI